MSRTAYVVDDHPGFRGCAKRVLDEHGFTVVGEAENAAAALEDVRRLRPELALVDVYLPDMDGFELAERLAALDQPPVVVLTSSHDPAEVQPRVPGCGARGFIPKEMLSREAIEALL
jgi:DNA-binding NarL/FixJ family response regulator